MSDLTPIEKLRLEKILGMGSGYVLDFSNRTFYEFILEYTSIDIYDKKYSYASGSKANRLRAFWTKESNYIVGKLMGHLLEYCKANRPTDLAQISNGAQALYDECYRISERLKQDSAVENIDVIRSNIDDKDFSLLAKSIRDSIQKNEPEAALDRLHTFVMKFVRRLCDRHEIEYDTNKPLHSIFGEYVKHLNQNNIVESHMTERILKMSISILEAFNDVRNKQSLAHDNPILNYDESMLIFHNVSSSIKFIESIEAKLEEDENENKGEIEYDDLPF